jgi:hypothetical protein
MGKVVIKNTIKRGISHFRENDAPDLLHKRIGNQTQLLT